MAKYTFEQIADAKKLLAEVSQERGEKKYADGWQYKEALDYLCENALGMKLPDIFTSTKLRYKLADGTYWYGTGKWPKEMVAHAEALMRDDLSLKKVDARQKTKHHFSKDDRAAARKLTDEEKRIAAREKAAAVKSLAQEITVWFAEHFKAEQAPEKVVEQEAEKPAEQGHARPARPARPPRQNGANALANIAADA